MKPGTAVKWYCGQHVRETPWDETPQQWIERATRTEAALNARLGAKVNRADMVEVITTLEEIESVHAGTHPDLVQNRDLTVNNKPDLLDGLTARLNSEVNELLTRTEPLQLRQEVMA